MKMIARFLALILCATLALAVNRWSYNVASRIRIAHCRSICLINHTVNGVKCLNYTAERNCLYCWTKCEQLGNLQEGKRRDKCNEFYKHKLISIYQGAITACLFYETRGAEKDKYEPSRLPAPEKCKIVRMKDHDVAVLMRRNNEGRWVEDNYYSADEISALPVPAGAWIIVASEDGMFKHYSWEIWKPTLESLKKGNPLYQAHITWKDWHAQLEQQLVEYQKANPELKFGFYPWKEKPSFVVTWQYVTGDGIMGNQVTDSESAHISLPSDSKYLVRITTDDSPGSYPIVINTRNQFQEFIFSWDLYRQLYNTEWLILIAFPLIIIIICLLLCLLDRCKSRCKSSKLNKIMIKILDEERQTQKKMKKNDKKPRESYIYQVYQNISLSKTIPNANLLFTNAQRTKTNSQDTNANLQDAKADLQNVNSSSAAEIV